MNHIPVLLTEVVQALRPTNGEQYVDGTFGAGGYTREILNTANCNVLGLDRDPNVSKDVSAVSSEFGNRFSFKQIAFSHLEDALDGQKVDGVVLDIGVSSMQLDQADRGFSFMREGPLDMRMSSSGPSAADAIKYLESNELARIFKVYGDEKRAKKCADFIVRARQDYTISTTQQLADILSRALGRQGKHHPATRVFQALRIYINDELGELYRALIAAEKVLRPGGRLVVVTFHSLEDRIVKSFLRSRSEVDRGGSRHAPPQDVGKTAFSFSVPKRSGFKAGAKEIAENPRSRSARLRWGVRLDAPVWQGEEDLLPEAPSLGLLERRAA
ncbi:MAG: 16S rRNA (cytosine(1402)-N(4))-methyltransferase RsmH [Acidimicrobiales bacterium]|nr:16S rRNA (cytosine(1402)-N(4))-methyltransferase RsmH [Hyphomonadaceae bacterium]RZV40724.1 MAG: 16S rRNA (cytosine(1402)-N(4))-methyltransferase RsmH [Acidimicrobiales bacterium]